MVSSCFGMTVQIIRDMQISEVQIIRAILYSGSFQTWDLQNFQFSQKGYLYFQNIWNGIFLPWTDYTYENICKIPIW